MRERGESDAGSVDGAQTRNCYSHVTGCGPLAAGAAATGGKSVVGVDGRGSRAPDHVLDQRNIDEIPAGVGGSPTFTQHRDRSYSAARGTDHFGAYGRDLWNFARAAFLEPSASGGVKGGYRERARWTQEGAPRERLGSGASLIVAAAADLRGTVHPQFYECGTS